jgi:hypothetical protein
MKSELLQRLRRGIPGAIRSLFRPTLEHTKDSGSCQQTSLTEGLSNMYDTPRKINVERFYEIMTTGNLELLKVNPKESVSEERLNDVWLDLQEYYYTNTNASGFKKFKNNYKTVVLYQNEIVACSAGLKLIEFDDEYGYSILEKFGIKDRDQSAIRSAILRKETKLNLAKSKMDQAGKNEAISFYKIVASVERGLSRQLNLNEVNLERWVAYLSELKEKHEAEKKDLHKRKSKRE